MDITFFVNKTLALLTVASQIFLVFAVIYLLFFRKKENAIFAFLGKRGILFACIVALGATISSLTYSEIIGFTPCELCWWQRIFMYPEFILQGLPLFKKDRRFMITRCPFLILGFSSLSIKITFF